LKNYFIGYVTIYKLMSNHDWKKMTVILVGILTTKPLTFIKVWAGEWAGERAGGQASEGMGAYMSKAG
jgi:hypothetical protein